MTSTGWSYTADREFVGHDGRWGADRDQVTAGHDDLPVGDCGGGVEVVQDVHVTWNQRQLHRLITEYIDHHHDHRPHRALQQRAPTARPDANAVPPSPIAGLIHLPRCDRLINEYRNAA